MKRYFFLFIFLLVCVNSYTQTGAYTNPKEIYVGDRAAFILPLSVSAAGLGAGELRDITLNRDSPGFPFDPNIDFHRIVLERRPSGSRLLIEFSPFMPGLLELPPIEIGSERFTGFKIEVKSVLGSGSAGFELAPPASVLAVPGTGILIYGTLAVLTLLTFLVLLFVFRGRRYLQIWLLIWKYYRLMFTIKASYNRLYRALLRGKEGRLVLENLCVEFRVFLVTLTGENCLSMTAAELEKLYLYSESFGPFLGNFFRRSDELRFSGGVINKEDVLPLFADLKKFIETLEKMIAGEKPWNNAFYDSKQGKKQGIFAAAGTI